MSDAPDKLHKTLWRMARDLDGKAAVATRTEGLERAAPGLASDADALRQAIATIRAQREEIARLREALEPFAAEYEYWKNDVPERLMLSDGDGTLSPADIPWLAIERAAFAVKP